MIRISDLFMCPRTGRPVRIDLQSGMAVTADEEIKYPILNGIIDFCSADSRGTAIVESYDAVSDSYDKLLTSATFLTRLYNQIVWGLDDADYVDDLLSLFPLAHNKVILDVPVGTGVFTLDLYKKIAKSSQIIVLDYSLGMLKKAKERYERNGIDNIVYVRGDIGRLPLPADSVDILLTMNGYHAFPEKEKALREMALGLGITRLDKSRTERYD
jgi:ubiquinone/menaquinone biosynthesis C-methylase UbiE